MEDSPLLREAPVTHSCLMPRGSYVVPCSGVVYSNALERTQKGTTLKLSGVCASACAGLRRVRARAPDGIAVGQRSARKKKALGFWA